MARLSARFILGALALVAMTSLVSCDLPEPGEHREYQSYGTCSALDAHFWNDSGFGSLTIKESGSSCTGVGAEVRYRGTDGSFRNSGWIFGAHSAVRTAASAVSSPESHHQICTIGSTCGSFTY